MYSEEVVTCRPPTPTFPTIRSILYFNTSVVISNGTVLSFQHNQLDFEPFEFEQEAVNMFYA